MSSARWSRFAALLLCSSVSLGSGLTLAGCSEQKLAAELPFGGAPPTVDGRLTWYKDVLPIARQHCQGCHRPDGIGPFSMLDHASAKVYAASIKDQVSAHRMPPWMPTQACGEYVGERRLSEPEIATFNKWVDDGAVAGDPADAPPGGDAQAPHLASVDATLQMNTVYTPVGDPQDPKRLDDYHCFVLDPALTADRDVIGFEIIPGVTREVHHVLLYAASKVDTDAADAKTPEPGWTCFGGPGVPATGGLGGWVPGMPPILYPATTGVRLAAGSRIVMQVHYNLSNGPPAPDQTTVKFDYAETPVSRLAVQIPLVENTFQIPTGGMMYSTSATFTSPSAGRIWGVTPHMHTLGRRISVDVGGTCLIDVPGWDFHWQQSYFFTEAGGRAVKAGDQINLHCSWQNNGDKIVTWGEGTADEMCIAFLYATQ